MGCASWRRSGWRPNGSKRLVWRIAATIGPVSFQAASSSAWRWRVPWSTIPGCFLADEPTGDLDAVTAGLVFDLIERLHATHGLTSILVTHNLDLAARCTRTLRLEAGRLETGRRVETGKREAGGPEAGSPDGGRLTAEEASVPQAN